LMRLLVTSMLMFNLTRCDLAWTWTRIFTLVEVVILALKL
jgi:hypothetical protein